MRINSQSCRPRNREQSPEKRKSDAALSKRLNQASQGEKAELALEYFRSSTNTNRIVIERSIDTSFLLEQANQVLNLIPALKADSVDATSIDLPSHATRVTLPNSTHLNYHDIAMLFPFLKYGRATGKRNPKTNIELRNQIVRRFISANGERSNE